MPKPWLRLWDKVLDSSKSQSLPDKTFKAWINLLCVANRNEPRGTLPNVKECAFALRVKPDAAQGLIEELTNAGFIDKEGDILKMHQWEEWQPDYDLSTDRAAKSKAKKRLATLQQHNDNVPLAGAQAGRRSEEIREEEETEGEEKPQPPTIRLGPEYGSVGQLAMNLGGDVSWGPFVSHQGMIGHPATWIEHALTHCPKGKFNQDYIAGTLRGYKRNGGPPADNKNGKPATQPKQAITPLTSEQIAANMEEHRRFQKQQDDIRRANLARSRPLPKAQPSPEPAPRPALKKHSQAELLKQIEDMKKADNERIPGS